jgi:hypothetical protein
MKIVRDVTTWTGSWLLQVETKKKKKKNTRNNVRDVTEKNV